MSNYEPAKRSTAMLCSAGSSNCPLDRRSEILNKLVECRVRADPEPDDVIARDDAKGPISEADANRVNRVAGVNALEAQARMSGVLQKQPISETSLPFHMLGQARVLIPEATGSGRLHIFLGSSGRVRPFR